MIARLGWAAATLLLALPAPGHGDGVELRFQPPAGASWVTRLDVVQNNTSRVTPEFAIESVSEQLTLFEQRVLQVADDGQVTVEHNYRRMAAESRMNDMDLSSFDTDQGEALGEDYRVFLALIDQPLTLTMTATASVVSIEGFEAMEQSISGENSMAAEMLKIMGRDSMENQLAQFVAALPTEVVAPGASWRDERELLNPVFGAIEFVSEFDFEAIEACPELASRRCARLATRLSSELEVRPELVDIAREGGELDFELFPASIEGRGSMWVDLATGVTLTSRLDIEVDMAMTIGGGEGEGEANDLAMRLEQTSTLQVVDYTESTATPAAQ